MKSPTTSNGSHSSPATSENGSSDVEPSAPQNLAGSEDFITAEDVIDDRKPNDRAGGDFSTPRPSVPPYFTGIVPHAFSTDYEDLFVNDGYGDRPCYLPDDGPCSDVEKLPESDSGSVRVKDDSLEHQEGLDDHTLDPPSLRNSHEGTSYCMAESGSSPTSASGSSSGDEESRGSVSGQIQQTAESTSSANWVPGKRHPNEDDSFESWRKHRKHFFILSNAGKPIFSRYGDEHKLAGFSATLQAIMSFVENSGDLMHSIKAGDHQIVFLVKGPLYLVSISATEEPIQSLKGQLELLHGQMLLILTKAVEKCFLKNPKFDMRPLLGGTEVVFSSLIHAFSWNPGTFLHAYTCLPLPYVTRQAAGVALQDVAESGNVFALLMSGSKVICLAGSRKSPLHPDDICLLSNFVSSSESFRTTESFSPVCLPCYNATAFLYAYIQYIETETCLVLLTADSGAFFYLQKCRQQIETALRQMNVLRDINLSLQNGGLHIDEVPTFSRKTSETAGSVQGPSVGGTEGLYHFLYRSTYLDQFVASEYSSDLQNQADQKRLFRLYQKLHASMHDVSRGALHKMQYRRDAKFVLLAWRTADFELYAAFNPSAEKGSAIAVCNRVCHWLRDMESDIFLLGTAPFNW